jgi:predicted porin
VASPAWSQGAAGGLFGATRSDVGARDRLAFTFQAAEGFDSELPPELRARVPQQRDGWSTLFTGSSEYVRRGSIFELAGTASSAVRYHHQMNRLETLSHSGGLGLAIKLPKQGSFQVNSTVAYSPSYLYQLFPTGALPSLGASIPTNPEYRLAENPSYSYRTSAGLSFGSRLGTMVATSGEFHRTEFEEPSTREDLEFYDVGAAVTHAFGRSGSVSTGYHYRAGQFGFGELTTEHRLTVGGEVSTALSRTRRATFRFNVTPARLDLPPTVASRIGGEPTSATGEYYRINGEVSVRYPFRLNWLVGAAYRRELEFLPVLSEPVFSDGSSLQLTGLLTRRLDLSVMAGYARGASALSRTTSDLESYTADIRLRYGLKHWFAVYTQYAYYHYDLGGQADLAPELPSAFDQHSARVGLMLFLEARRK